MSIQSSLETIYHYTCNDCLGWWSIAALSEHYNPPQLWCPHCGTKHIDIDRKEYEKIRAEYIDKNVPPEI